jgi:hypothetical protein
LPAPPFWVEKATKTGSFIAVVKGVNNRVNSHIASVMAHHRLTGLIDKTGAWSLFGSLGAVRLCRRIYAHMRLCAWSNVLILIQENECINGCVNQHSGTLANGCFHHQMCVKTIRRLFL